MSGFNIVFIVHYKMFDENQKWSCECQCEDHICTIGFIIYSINIFKWTLHG